MSDRPSPGWPAADSGAGSGRSAFQPQRPGRVGATLRWTLAVSLVLGVHGAAAWVLLNQEPEAAPQGAEAAPILIDMAPPAAAPEVASLDDAEPAPQVVDTPQEAPPPREVEPEPTPEPEAPPPEPVVDPVPETEATPPPEPEPVEPEPEQPEVAEPEPPVEEPPLPVDEVEEIQPPEETAEPTDDAISVPIPTFRPPTPPAVLEAVREREEQRQERAERRERAEREERRERREARRAPPPSAASQGRQERQASQGRQVSRAAQSRWQSAVQARLNRAKRTPAGGGSGTVTIAFSLNGNGQVTSARVARSGGRVLDNAAIALLRRASPFPPPPAGRGVSLTVPIRFE